MAQILPTFFIIGAAKCGTTSLHFYLSEHPELSMASVKEPHVFGEARRLVPRPDFEGLFDARIAIRGESSTGYTRFPAEGNAAEKISAAVPGARLIYLVGEPVERVVSDYVQQVAVGEETRSLQEALADHEDPGNWYVCASRYGQQLEQYLQHFDRRSILVLEQWALRHEREQTLRTVFEFLGVDPDFWSANFKPEMAKRDDHVRHNGVVWRFRASSIGSAYRRLPVRLRLPVSRALKRRSAQPERPELTPELRASLTAVLVPEMDRLRELTGLPFPHLPSVRPAVRSHAH